MADLDNLDRVACRFGVRTQCCDRIVCHVTPTLIVCRGCGTLYIDVTALVRAAFPGAVDVTTMTPADLLRGKTHAVVQ